MGVGIVGVAAATAVVGYDMAVQQIWQGTSQPRILTGFAVCGSTAAGDAKVELWIDTVKIAEAFNTTTGVPTQDHLAEIDNAYVPPGSLLHCYVTDAPNANPLYVMVTWQNVEEA